MNEKKELCHIVSWSNLINGNRNELRQFRWTDISYLKIQDFKNWIQSAFILLWENAPLWKEPKSGIWKFYRNPTQKFDISFLDNQIRPF